MKNNYYLRTEGKEVFMCCGKANCPSVKKSVDSYIEISDDFGNKIKVKKEEASLISEAVTKLEEIN